jgi:hypothetical protein
VLDMREMKPPVDEKFPCYNCACIYFYYFSLSSLLIGPHVSLFQVGCSHHGCGGLCARHERDVTRVDANSLFPSLFLYLCLLVLISLFASFFLSLFLCLSLYLPDMAVMELLCNIVVCLSLFWNFVEI